MAELRYHDKNKICWFRKRRNSKSFNEQLKQLDDCVKQEGIEQGKSQAYFEYKVNKTLII